jgi:hypothetical protein
MAVRPLDMYSSMSSVSAFVTAATSSPTSNGSSATGSGDEWDEGMEIFPLLKSGLGRGYRIRGAQGGARERG